MLVLIIVLCTAALFVRWLHKKNIPSNSNDNRSKNVPATVSVINSAYSSALPGASSYDYIENNDLVIPNLNHDQGMKKSHAFSNGTAHDENVQMLGLSVAMQVNPC